MALSNGSLAAVSADEAKQLGATLTPWGAEKAGNKEGTIPEWTGQVKIPANYDPNYRIDGWYTVPPKPDVYYASKTLAGEGIR